jgi:hypothetical protein
MKLKMGAYLENDSCDEARPVFACSAMKDAGLRRMVAYVPQDNAKGLTPMVEYLRIQFDESLVDSW